MSFKTQEKIIAISFTSESLDNYLFLEKVSVINLAERLKSNFGNELGSLVVNHIMCLDCSKKEHLIIEKKYL